LAEKRAEGWFEFNGVQGVADVVQCLSTFLLLWRPLSFVGQLATQCERSWSLCLSV